MMHSGCKWLFIAGLSQFGIFGSFALSAQCPAQLRLPYNSSWLPYVEVNANKVTGTDIDLIRQVVQDVGSELQLLYMPESRALNDLEGGKVDLLFAASYTEERSKYAWFSQPYRNEVSVVIVHPLVLERYPELKNKTTFWDLARRKLIGTVNPKGFYGAAFEQLKKQKSVQHRLVAIFDAEQRMALVLSQRADYTVADKASIRIRFETQPMYQQLIALPFELDSAEIHLMLSKKTVSADCVALINQSLSKYQHP
ncbi:MAG: transporter substrate-binding domain-containing protein [Gammaproteobacteria bacterium]|nr:transporter substrate-binding domain-containing protein [Gammaproteobacteria bacterium]MBU2426112.1 transporter substrate-binding domain-containing protein [Gammaproteobacteria bacterium]